MALTFLTVADLKAELRIEGPFEDTRLGLMIEDATAYVAAQTGYDFASPEPVPDLIRRAVILTAHHLYDGSFRGQYEVGPTEAVFHLIAAARRIV